MSFIFSLSEWLRKVSKSFMNASISGKDITLTRHNGDTVTLTTQDTVNNAFTKIKIGTATLEPDAVNDTLTLGVGAGIMLSANTTNDSITVSGVEATQSIAGIMSTTDKIKLDGISAGAEVNQNTFAIVKVGATNITADAKQDTLNLIEGSNVTLSPNATNDSITISATDTTYGDATTSASGLMSSTDKTKLDGISAGAEVNQNAFSKVKVGSTTIVADAKTDTLELVAGSNVTLTPDATNDKITIAATDTVYTHPSTSGNKHIPSGGSSGQILRWSADGTAAWGADSNTTYPAFSTARYINAGSFVDAMVLYDNDAQSNRASVIRVFNGNGYHELLLGVNNESNGAPNGLAVRSTNGTITASLPGTLTVNGIKIGTGNIGTATKPVYVNSGSITACSNDMLYSAANGTNYVKFSNEKQLCAVIMSQQSAPANSYSNITVTWPRAFKDTAYSVLATLVTGSTALAYGNIQIVVDDVTKTTTSVKIRLFNRDSSNRQPSFRVLAFGEGAA